MSKIHSSIPRRTLQELAFLYARHPDRCDVYVEGPSDKAIVSWILRELKLPSICVYTIEAIEVLDGEIIASGRSANNRERVVFLSQFLADHHVKRATCVIDVDFYHIKPKGPLSDNLLMTDYSCIEMYFFNEVCLSKFFSLFCCRDDCPVENIMNALSSVLQEFFLYRFANFELNWQMDWLDSPRCIKLRGWRIILDRDDYVRRFLSKNGKSLKYTVFFNSKVEELRCLLLPDTRYQIHGHDFISILSWYIRQKGISHSQVRPDDIWHCISMSADVQSLSEENMFKDLVNRLSGSVMINSGTSN